MSKFHQKVTQKHIINLRNISSLHKSKSEITKIHYEEVKAENKSYGSKAKNRQN